MNAEQFHDALSLLPSDLIAETDKLRASPKSRVIPWKRWASLAACLVLIFGCGWAVVRSGLLGFSGGSTKTASFDEAAAECAPQEPAAMYSNQKTTEAAQGTNDSSVSLAPQEDLTDNAPADANREMEEAMTPTGYPADGSYFIDLNAAQSILTYPAQDGNLCIDSSQTALIRTAAGLENYLGSWGDYFNLYALEEACAAFDEGWFECFDLLLIRVDTEKSELHPVIDSFTLTGPESCEIVICSPLMPEDNSPDPACWHILLPVEKDLLPEAIDITLLFP